MKTIDIVDNAIGVHTHKVGYLSSTEQGQGGKVDTEGLVVDEGDCSSPELKSDFRYLEWN